jgi:TolB-like protein
MPEQSHPLGAVFISYCSQDAPAAERICDALRAVGIDVWLDKNELRGGDAWDAQIRKRIHDCALFIPVISANTNARNEGYFRREWKQAIRRLEDLADDVAFLVPVVIDETTEADARVPEEFLRAHWVWLPAGDVPAAFPQRVRQLLGQDHAVVSARGPTATGAIEPGARAAGASGHRGAPFLRRFGLPLIALLLAVIGGLTWYYVGGREIPAAKSAVTAVQAAPNDKSIAVLPFVNMSPDPEQEYFSDGVSEQILNLLSKIPELRVIARTSSFAFKGKEDTDVASIARALNVSHILEGSVQKSANRVRINAQLINAARQVLRLITCI